MTVLRNLIRAVRSKPRMRRLVCRCGGAVALGGEPVPRYTCQACGNETATLMALEAK